MNFSELNLTKKEIQLLGRLVVVIDESINSGEVYPEVHKVHLRITLPEVYELKRIKNKLNEGQKVLCS